MCENPWEKGKLLVRRVKQITSDEKDVQKSVVWVSSETMNGGIDSKAFGYLPIESILGRACYYYNSTLVGNLAAVLYRIMVRLQTVRNLFLLIVSTFLRVNISFYNCALSFSFSLLIYASQL